MKSTKDQEAQDVSPDPGEVHHKFGQTSRELLPRSRMPVIFSLVLLLAVCVLGYRFLTNQSAGSMEEMGAPKPLFSNRLSNSARNNDLVAKARKLFESSQIDESLATYEKFLQASPTDAEAMNDIGILYLKKQKLIESEAHLKRSVELAPECVACLNNLGYLKTLQGRQEEAETYFKKALALNSDYIDPYFNLGVLYEKNGDFARSAESYREFLKRSKDKDSTFNIKLKQHLDSLLEK